MRPGAGLFAVSLAELETAEPKPWRIWPRPGAPDEPGEPAGDPSCSSPPPADLFYAHGLGSRPGGAGTTRVAVVNHGGREAIELFDLGGSGRDARLAWRGCVPLPPGLLGNDVALAPDGELIVTNFVPLRRQPLLYLEILAAALGFDSGEVLGWRAGRGWRSVSGTRGAGPNGVLLSPDGETVVFAENGRARIVLVPRAGGEPARIDVGDHVDDLTWDDGRILAVVHTGGARALFESCLMDWAIVEADPGTRAARRIFAHAGQTLCGATSALRLGERIYVGTMSETRIGVLRPGR